MGLRRWWRRLREPRLDLEYVIAQHTRPPGRRETVIILRGEPLDVRPAKYDRIT